MTLQETLDQILNRFLSENNSEHVNQLGLSHWGTTALNKPLSFEFYQSWIEQGYHGDMKYLKDHLPIKEQAQRKWPRARSAIVFAMPYFPHPETPPQPKLQKARVSLYAQGYDYHFWFRERMEKLCEILRKQFPGEEFLPLTDSSPVLERDLARRAGLGWVGKNTCLIHPKKGSLFFIGEIYSSLELKKEFEPLPDFCGKCTRCVDICPTGALLEPRKMDARKCISYLTIESRELPPEPLREKIGDWFFGCDLCQTVCPWNEKLFKGRLSIEKKKSLAPSDRNLLIADLRHILTASGKKLEKDFWGTPLARAGSFGLKRNALIVCANQNLRELEPEVSALGSHDKLGSLANWVLAQFAQ